MTPLAAMRDGARVGAEADGDRIIVAQPHARQRQQDRFGHDAERRIHCATCIRVDVEIFVENGLVVGIAGDADMQRGRIGAAMMAFLQSANVNLSVDM